VAVAVVPAPSATSETPDVTSVVSLNGFLPSEKARERPIPQPGGRVPSEPAAAQAAREFVRHGSSTVVLSVRH